MNAFLDAQHIHRIYKRRKYLPYLQQSLIIRRLRGGRWVADMVNIFYFISLLTPFLTDFIHILGERFPFPSPLKMLKGENKQSFMLWNFSFLFILVAKCGWNPLQVLILCKHKNDYS
jgi:hypothetical protein